MPVKSTSAPVTPAATHKPVRAASAKPRPKVHRMSKLEARHLDSFKALMKKFGGKLKFAGCDE